MGLSHGVPERAGLQSKQTHASRSFRKEPPMYKYMPVVQEFFYCFLYSFLCSFDEGDVAYVIISWRSEAFPTLQTIWRFAFALPESAACPRLRLQSFFYFCSTTVLPGGTPTICLRREFRPVSTQCVCRRFRISEFVVQTSTSKIPA